MLPRKREQWKLPVRRLRALTETIMKSFRKASVGKTAAVALLVLLLAFVLFVIATFLRTPGTAELSAIRHYEASSAYTSDGELLGRYYVQNRDEIPIDHVPQHFLDALLAIEDIRFHNHNGIDCRALGRVLVRTIMLRQDAGGGSTITQQLAKNLYPRENPGLRGVVTGKLREMVIGPPSGAHLQQGGNPRTLSQYRFLRGGYVGPSHGVGTVLQCSA